MFRIKRARVAARRDRGGGFIYGPPPTRTGVDATLTSEVEAPQWPRVARRQAAWRFEAAFENSSLVAIQGFDRDGVILHWNAASTALYGFNASEAIGKRLQDLLHTGDAAREFEQTVARIWETGEAIPAGEWPVNTANGRRLWVYSTMFPVFQNAEVCEIFCMDVDITERKRVEAALRESEERFALVVSAANDGVWDWDIAGGRIYYSPRWKAMLGYTDAELPNRRDEWRSRIHPDDLERVMAELSAHLAGQSPHFACEYRLRHKSGNYQWILSRGLALFGASGKPYRMSGSHTDITQRRRGEESLRQSEARKTAILDAALDCIITTDSQGRIVEFNQAAERTFGYRQQDAMGKSLTELFIPPDLQESHQQVVQRHLTPEKNGSVLGERMEMRALRADGSEFPVELTITPINVGGTLLTTEFVRDISERKQAEAALLEIEERLRLAVEAAEIGTWDWDGVTGKLTWSDRCKALFGLAPETDVDCAFFESRLHPEDRERAQQARFAAFDPAGTGEYAIDARCIWPDGTVHWLSATGRAFFELKGGERRPHCVIGVARDITERKQKEADLQRSNVELRGLSSHLQLAREAERAHIARELHDEVGQSLTAIILHLDAMLRSAGSALSPRLEECLAIVNQTIKQVRDLSLELRPPQLDNSGLAASLRWMLDRQAKAAGLLIEFAADPSLGRLPPDLEITCFRVAQESVTNAARHAAATRLSIELFKQDPGLHLIVRDNGRGFDVAAASSQALRGVTFGLVGMRERVQSAGGELELTSNEGHGTKVHATFSLDSSPQDLGPTR